jgi:C1A family cysteine protease
MYSSVYKKTVKTLFLPSRLFLYYNTRVLENTASSDSGATLRDTLKSLSRTGVCPETLWPYSNQNLFRKPGTAAYSSATTNRAVAYASLDTTNLGTLKAVLTNGSVFVLGMLVYQSFMTMNGTWVVPTPNTNKEKLLGGHAVCVVGYDDSKKCFLVRNSWGTSWGLKGNFWLPYSFATNPRLVFDAWVLYSVQSPPPGSNIQKN